jgi:hypothetical protein
LVPAFAAGRTNALLNLLPGQVTAARATDETEDWENFYVIMSVNFSRHSTHQAYDSLFHSWVDRDMIMRYLGDAVGHLAHRDSVWLGHDDADVNGLGDAGDEEADEGSYVRAESMADAPLPSMEDVPEDGPEEDAEPNDDEMDDDDEELTRSDGEEDDGGNIEEEDSEDDGGNIEEEDSDDEGFEFDDEGFIDI